MASVAFFMGTLFWMALFRTSESLAGSGQAGSRRCGQACDILCKRSRTCKKKLCAPGLGIDHMLLTTTVVPLAAQSDTELPCMVRSGVSMEEDEKQPRCREIFCQLVSGSDLPLPPPYRDLAPSTSSSVVYNPVSRVFLLFHHYRVSVE